MSEGENALEEETEEKRWQEAEVMAGLATSRHM